MSVSIRYQEVREWPGEKTPVWKRQRAPFKAHATKLWDLLDRELHMVNAKDVTLSGYWRARDFKRDGGIYADARPTEPGVVLEFVRGKDRMRFACDKFLVWLDNVDAIARALEALRMVDRYGVTSGQQYEGFKALPAGVDVANPTNLALTITSWAGVPAGTPITMDLVRRAKAKAHPDAGGSHADFIGVQEAARRLGVQ